MFVPPPGQGQISTASDQTSAAPLNNQSSQTQYKVMDFSRTDKLAMQARKNSLEADKLVRQAMSVPGPATGEKGDYEYQMAHKYMKKAAEREQRLEKNIEETSKAILKRGLSTPAPLGFRNPDNVIPEIMSNMKTSSEQNLNKHSILRC